MLKNNSCSKCEKKVITRRVWSNKFASNRGKDARHTKSCCVRNKRCPVRLCSQQFSFQLFCGEAELKVQRLSCCSPYPAFLYLFWRCCPLMMLSFISLLIKRTSLQPVLPSDAGWEMVSPGIKLREIQTDLYSSDLGWFWWALLPTVCHSMLQLCARCHSAVDSSSVNVFLLIHSWQTRSSRGSCGLHCCSSSRWEVANQKAPVACCCLILTGCRVRFHKSVHYLSFTLKCIKINNTVIFSSNWWNNHYLTFPWLCKD